MLEMTLKNYQEKIDKRLDILISECESNYSEVISAARYSLFAGGKRIRPIILLEFYKLFGGSDDCAYNFACALEMIHTYSLIHDDLPCMDDDDMRRGKPSNHKKFGEAMALLAGDALLTESFGIAARTMGIDASLVSRAIAYLSANAGINGMIGGQVIDIDETKLVSNELLKEMYLLKTGALLKCACVCGAILAGANDDEIKLCEEYASNLGLAFQITDDILDCVGNAEKLGKPVGSDAQNGKKTSVSLFGIEKSKELAELYTNNALSVLDIFGADSETLRELTKMLLKRDY